MRLPGEHADHRAAQRIDGNARLPHDVARRGLPIRVFTGSPGPVQIHSGPVHAIKPTGPWLDMLDEDFDRHPRLDHVAETWIVKKPTADGPVTSLELYDAQGGQIVQFFGQRLPGRPGIAAWTELAGSLAPWSPCRRDAAAPSAGGGDAAAAQRVAVNEPMRSRQRS